MSSVYNTMIIFEYIFSVSSIIYFLLLIAAFVGLYLFKKQTNKLTPKISVIIAARNEEHRITPTLQSLQSINYPADSYEIIFVDDASTDNTTKIINEFAANNSNWKCIQIKEKDTEWHGKKLALKTGIDAANGEIIFTTDADIIVQPEWLTEMVKYFNHDASMVIGHYEPEINKNKLISILIKFDNLFSSIVASATANIGYPISSAGSNLAYRKDAYEKVNGHESLKHFKSGDDVHLTERFRTKLKKEIVYCANSKTFVFTKPPQKKKEFFHQQMRKNSKHLKKSISSIFFSAFLFLYFLLTCGFPMINPDFTNSWLLIIFIKLFLEFIVLTRAAFIFNRKDIIVWFPIFQIFYPIYIMVFSILGNLQFYEWNK
jgi:cellulose synthase/poly-beta-1,6-N-acetylglucosamine synthase-like glycosyltransferase